MENRREILKSFEQKSSLIEEKLQDTIENHRKGNAVITVKDKNGNAVKNAKISVNQKNHDFRYGCNLFLLEELESREKNELYKKYIAELCNMVTLPFYWDATEPQQGKTRYSKDSVSIYRRPPIDLCVEFCEQNKIEPREHALAYGGFFPQWLKELTLEEQKAAIERRYREISKRYADKINTIEVTNEMFWDRCASPVYFDPDFVKWTFELGQKYFPDNKLSINDATDISWKRAETDTNPYYKYLKKNIDNGVRIDAIGMQYHMFYKKEDEASEVECYYSPEHLYKVMDMMNGFGKPLQVTEVTIPAYSNDAEDELIQAEIIEWLYKIWFSHPAIEQIIYWNSVDGYAHLWDPSPEKIRASQGDMTLGENYYYGGLLRFDLSPKPAYFTIKNLFEKVWHTEETLVLDDNGIAEFKGFYGEYEVNIDGKVYTVNLSKGKDNNFVIEV